jgi:hypothetical protein
VSQRQASASKTIEEGSITTEASAFAFTNTAGETGICLFYSQSDTSTGTELVSLFGCGSPDEFTVSKQLDSATFSGTITGTDVVSGEEKTAIVNVELTATGKAETSTFNLHEKTHDFTLVRHANGKFAPASGSLNISGDITFSTDDATGDIGHARVGIMTVERI